MTSDELADFADGQAGRYWSWGREKDVVGTNYFDFNDQAAQFAPGASIGLNWHFADTDEASPCSPASLFIILDLDDPVSNEGPRTLQSKDRLHLSLWDSEKEQLLYVDSWDNESDGLVQYHGRFSGGLVYSSAAVGWDYRCEDILTSQSSDTATDLQQVDITIDWSFSEEVALDYWYTPRVACE